jgi:hypothetical protein
MTEKRDYQRIPFATKAEITCNSNKYHGELINISLQGALVFGKENISIKTGARCELLIHLPDSNITLQFESDIIYSQKNKFNFKFISEDIQTARHLRRLLELNIGSTEKIDKEIDTWIRKS